MSGSAKTCGTGSSYDDSIVRVVPARTDSTQRSTSVSVSTSRGYSGSRPVSMRATSSSSVISRESRSESEYTVVSISFFCSSLSRSHLLSRVPTKPFTPVERGAQLVGDGRDEVGTVAVEPGPAAAGTDHQRDALDRPERCGPG